MEESETNFHTVTSNATTGCVLNIINNKAVLYYSQVFQKNQTQPILP